MASEQVCQAFYTTKSSGMGIGLALAARSRPLGRKAEAQTGEDRFEVRFFRTG